MPGWQGERGSRQERGYGRSWDKLRLTILQRDGYLCQPCYRKGRPTPAKAVDHIRPKIQDGTDDPDNLESICGDCHLAKTTAEAAQARGVKPRTQYDAHGFPIWE